jgi:hypothetical protein|tara:strand:+ start:1553 stop:1822 length:270 start_codon:yes stop_codon:yes gene_type:complete
LQAFPGQEGGNGGIRLNIARIFDQEYNVIQDGMYRKVNMTNSVGKDEPTDACGYLGLGEHYRPRRPTVPISEQEFLRIMCEEKKVHAGA